MAHFLQHFLGCVPYFLHVPEGVTEYLLYISTIMLFIRQKISDKHSRLLSN